MNQNIERRKLLKSGLLGLTALAGLPYLQMGAFASEPLTLDDEGRIVRSPSVRELIPTHTGKPPVLAARLNANENPYGPSDAAQKAVIESVVRGNRYAWKELFDLVDKIAAKEGVTAAHIMMGPGSSDLLEKVAMVCFKDGGNIVSADPTYMSIVQVAKAVGATWKAVPCKADWSHDLKAMEAAVDGDTKLVYICNPNNPTGAITNGKELYDFCSRVSEKVPVFIDEAYIELAEGADTQSMASLLAQKKNVVIGRTFSKIMGLAGIRVGYIAAQPEFIERIGKITRGGMGIAYTSIYAATASLGDQNFQAMTKAKNAAAKKYIYGELDRLGYRYIPSYTNFVLFPIQMQGKTFLDAMAAKGVGIRVFEIQQQTWCRVSLGTMDEMKLFVSSLQTV
ncbi:pyridoxal phosphate-dependent aminotransferase [Flavihumibacter petaseus]|uniref:Putative histidinol-phosphate aminotransferase n=1 Tax=Flavihumibacter petaseus NBRC 106054 TaxID=1220578 RepID=A0A0E9MWV8_9BACT|nr:histidinol-phosphate transaminase [Flavihumibacter petaseus]GAO41605.1 putative histidinol-phosphate aminotransferase [Flavihumibacter petaseus NBRC 106054]